MKGVAVAFSAVGLASGLLLAIGGWFFLRDVWFPILAIATTVIGVLVVATHWANWKRLRDPSDLSSRSLLFAFNLVGALFFGYQVYQSRDIGWMWITLLYLLPFAVNAIYLCTSSAAGSPRD